MPENTHFWLVLDGKTDNGWSLMYECDVFTILNEKFQRVPAFTSSELMDILPCHLGQSTDDNGSGYLICYRVNDEVDEYECAYDGKDIPFTKANTAVDAYALMAIQLIKLNLWKPKF